MKRHLLSLAKRLAALKGPDRELDAEIQVRLFEKPDYRFPAPVLNRKPSDWLEACERFRWNGGGGYVPWPAYTHSIDDALKLIQGSAEYPDHKTYLLDCATQTTVHAQPVAYVWNDTGKHMGTGRTAPLAICIAAITARAAEEGN